PICGLLTSSILGRYRIRVVPIALVTGRLIPTPYRVDPRYDWTLPPEIAISLRSSFTIAEISSSDLPTLNSITFGRLASADTIVSASARSLTGATPDDMAGAAANWRGTRSCPDEAYDIVPDADRP